MKKSSKNHLSRGQLDEKVQILSNKIFWSIIMYSSGLMYKKKLNFKVHSIDDVFGL